MSDPLSRLPSYPPLPTDRENINSDPSATSNIPISDFRRNEARPIINDDGNSFVLSLLIHINMLFTFEFRLDRHKSVYHQPSLSTYNPSEKRKKRHRRSRPSVEPSEMSFRSIPSSETNDTSHIGKENFHTKTKI
jgi:hypothetical protein